MRHKVRDLGVFFCLAVMLFTVTSCGKEVSDQTIAATEQSSEERRDAEAVMRTETTEAFSTEKAGGVGMPDDLVYAAVIHIKINPEFNLYLDSEGCIVYVEYLNEDAADLFETVDLTGQKLADGMETIVGAAEEKGYLTGQNEVTTDVVWVQEKLSANSVAVRMESRTLFVMARVWSRMIVFSVMERRNVRYVAEAEKCREETPNGRT